jgi:hypothetical protein
MLFIWREIFALQTEKNFAFTDKNVKQQKLFLIEHACLPYIVTQ